MFTRIVECQARTGMGEEALKRVRLEVLPILQMLPGFVDLIALRDGNDQQWVVCLSFWNSKENSERYHREHYVDEGLLGVAILCPQGPLNDVIAYH